MWKIILHMCGSFAQATQPDRGKIVTGAAAVSEVTEQALRAMQSQFTESNPFEAGRHFAPDPNAAYHVEYQCQPVKKAPPHCRPFDLQFLSTDPDIIAAERLNSTQFALSAASRIALVLNVPINSIEVYPLSGDAQVFKANNSVIADCPGFESCPLAFLSMRHSTKREYYLHWRAFTHQAPHNISAASLNLNLMQKRRGSRGKPLPVGVARQSIKIGVPYYPESSQEEASRALQIAHHVKRTARELVNGLSRAAHAYARVLTGNGKFFESRLSQRVVKPSHPLQPFSH